MKTLDALRDFAQVNNLQVLPYKGVNIHYGDELQKWQLLFRHNDFNIKITAGKNLLAINVPHHEDGLITPLNFSLNRPHFFFHEPVTVPLPTAYEGITLYKEKKESARTLKSWIKKSESVRLLNGLHLNINESLFVLPGGAELNVNPSRSLSGSLDSLIALILVLPRESTEIKPAMVEIHGLEINPKALPEKLRVLVPLLSKWAIGDDVARETQYTSAPENEKRELVEIVRPLMSKINAYLDAHEGSNEATLLMYLAEGVSEID